MTFILHYFTLDSGEEIQHFCRGDDEPNGEYYNVAVLICQQCMYQFPDFYSKLKKTVSPQYIVSNFNVCDILIIT